MVEKAAVEEEMGGSQQAEGCSHIHHHLFVYIETTDHLQTDTVCINAAVKTGAESSEQNNIQYIRLEPLKGALFRRS